METRVILCVIANPSRGVLRSRSGQTKLLLLRDPFQRPSTALHAGLEKRIIIHFRKYRQFAADGGIEDFTSSVSIYLAHHSIAHLGGLQVRQLPAEAFAEIR